MSQSRASRRPWLPSDTERGPIELSDGKSEIASDDDVHQRRRRRIGLCAAGSIYLLLSIGLWWHVWISHPSSTAICGCGDTALFLWFIEWPAYAIAHGHNLFYSSALFHPGGINLLSNTSILAIGIPLVPVTWLFGPVASLNVASALAPALTGLAAFWTLRRFVKWQPAAFAGGLLYGFSPLVLGNLAASHLMSAMFVVPPLWLACLDELVLRHRRHPAAVGIALGLLATVQFFLSTELLVILILCTAFGLLMLVAYQAVTDRSELTRHVRRGAPGLVVAGIVTAALLSYPAWFALEGRARLSSPIWPNLQEFGGFGWSAFFDPTLGATTASSNALPDASFLGFGLVAVAVLGLVFWPRDRRLWFFSAVALLSALFSLTAIAGPLALWRYFLGLPIFEDVIQQRFVAITYLALAGVLAMVIDHVRVMRVLTPAAGKVVSTGTTVVRRLAAAPALAVAVLALGPIAWSFVPQLPFSTQSVSIPAWFAREGRHLPPHEVLLAYPPPFSGLQSAEAWQAVDRFQWAQAGGGGPQAGLKRAGSERPAFAVLSRLSTGFGGLPAGAPSELDSVRHALRAWRVTMVVIPDQPGISIFVRGQNPVYAAAFMTTAIGRAPIVEDGAWVWSDTTHLAPALHVRGDTILRCTRTAERPHRPLSSAPACVLAAARGATGRPTTLEEAVDLPG